MELSNNKNYAQCLKCCNLVWLTSKTWTKTRTKRKQEDGYDIQVIYSKTQLNEPTTWVKYPTLLYAKNHMANNIIYKGQVYKLDQHQCNSYNYVFFPQIHLSS